MKCCVLFHSFGKARSDLTCVDQICGLDVALDFYLALRFVVLS